MRLSSLFFVGIPFLLAALLSLVAASFAVSAIEDGSEIGVRRALDENRLGWAEVEANGLQVILAGTAPSELERFRAISIVGGVVDAARIIDMIEVAPAAELAPPKFSAEMLRNDSGISVIGLIPAATDRERLIERLQQVAGTSEVADLLETADYPVPNGWTTSLDFAVNALSRLKRSKISVSADQITITAISDSASEKAALERDLNRSAPAGLRMALLISAPRPVITPFTLRFIRDEHGARFDACSAESEESKARLLAAARAAGLEGPGTCTIGMGVPSPNWARAGELSMAALTELGRGTVTMANADITLVAAQDTDPALFDRVVGELETALPKVFALHAVLPEPEKAKPEGPSEFTATLSPEGQVQLRGRLSDENLRRMADSYARARFGSDNVYTAARVVPDLPADWPIRVLAGLEALSLLSNGVVTVTPDMLSVRGVSMREDASATAAGLLSDKLGSGARYELDITYRPPPEPENAAPDPETCERQIAEVQARHKITFDPGSARISSDSLDTMNAIADILRECGEIRLEIQGHTDSQGREEMNLQLSQARAQSVLNELRARRVLTSTYVAVGYGESDPIADNDTEEGREANRRIEFRLLRAAAEPDGRDGPEVAADAAGPADANGAADAEGPADADGAADADAAAAESGSGDAVDDAAPAGPAGDGKAATD